MGKDISENRINTVLHHYVMAALWSSTNPDNEEEEFLDENYSIEDIDEKLLESMKSDIKKFISENYDAIEKSGMSDEQLGHDLWLTRNGHGAGFWDRGYEKEVSDKLSDSAREMKGIDLYVGDDGKIHALQVYSNGGDVGYVFRDDTNEWFDLVADNSKKFENNKEVLEAVEICNKEASRENLEKLRGVIKTISYTESVKKKIDNQINNILEGKYKKEFRFMFGGKRRGGGKTSTTSEFFSMFVQASTYDWENSKYSNGGGVGKGKIKFFEVADRIKRLQYDVDPTDLRLHSEESFRWGAKTEEDYRAAEKEIDSIKYKGKGWEIYGWYDVSGFDYWMKRMEETNYIQLTIAFDKDTVDESEVEKIDKALDSALADADAIQHKYDYDPYYDKDEEEMKCGGGVGKKEKYKAIFVHETTGGKKLKNIIASSLDEANKKAKKENTFGKEYFLEDVRQFGNGGGVSNKKSFGGFIAGAAVGSAATYLLTKGSGKKEEQKSEQKKLSWKEEVVSDINNEGFFSAFNSYSDYSDVKNEKFHELRKSYLSSAKKLEKYVDENENQDSLAEISVKDAADKEGFDYAVTGYHNWSGINDKKFHELRKDYISNRNALAKYLGIKEKYSSGGGLDKYEPYRYVNIKKVKDGLQISLNEEGVELVKELKEQGQSDWDIWADLFESVQGNSEYIFHADMGDSGFGLTSAEGITDGFYYNGERGEMYKTDYPESAKVYWFPNYMVVSSLDKMIKEGSVVFDEAESNDSEEMKNGGGVTEYDKGVVLVKTKQAKNHNEVWDILNEKWSKYDIVNSRYVDLETPYSRSFIADGTLIDVKLLKKDGKYYWDWKAKYSNGGGVNSDCGCVHSDVYNSIMDCLNKGREVSVEALTLYLDRKPNYKEEVGGFTLVKCYLRPYFKIK